jgi:pimeloyl-ACP methyl ester carboxylesterase
MSEARTGFATLPNGGRLAYRVSGAPTAPALMLLRPLGGSIALWTELERPLSTAFQVVSFDPLGAGRSSDVSLSYTTRGMARDAIALLDQLGIRRCHLFGLSLGSMVASWLALDFTDRLERVVLASTLGHLRAISPQRLQQAASLAHCVARPGICAELCFVHRILSPRFRAQQPERVRAIERTVLATPAKRRNLIGLGLAAVRPQTTNASRCCGGDPTSISRSSPTRATTSRSNSRPSRQPSYSRSCDTNELSPPRPARRTADWWRWSPCSGPGWTGQAWSAAVRTRRGRGAARTSRPRIP